MFIDEQDTALYAVIRFRGSWTKANYDKHHKQLLAFLDTKPVTITSGQIIMRYNPPMVPGMFKRNEIAYQIQQNKSN